MKEKYINKFKSKCEKKLKFMEQYKGEGYRKLISLNIEIASAINKNMDTETYNRIVEHPRRSLYHANQILKINKMMSKQDMINLQILIMFHDIGKVVDYKKYKANMKKDHHIFSEIITRTAMEYMNFDEKQIELISWCIYNHNDVSKTMEECLAAPIIYQMLLDVDKLDENDIYGVILKSIIKGNDNNISKNNMINQKDLLEWINEFRLDKNYDRLLLEESKEYYIKMKNIILILVNELDFNIDYTVFDL